MNRRTFATAGILLFVVASGMGQSKHYREQQDEAIRVKTELMEVHAVVVDSKGRIIEDLKKEDFELLENERPQNISFFTLSEVESKTLSPQPGKPARVAEKKIPDALPDKIEALRQPPARSTLLFVDNLHMSFSSLHRVKMAMRRFIKEQMTDQDMVAVATSSHTLGIAEQFTRDRQQLNYAIEQIRYSPCGFERSFTPSLAAGVLANRVDSFRIALDILRREEGGSDCCNLLRRARAKALLVLNEGSFCRKTSISILRDYAEQMRRVPGKRMILVFSDGFTLYDSDAGIHTDQLQPAIDRAVRSGIAIYTVDAKGLQVPPTIDAAKNMTIVGGSDSFSYDKCSGSGEPAAGCEPPDPALVAGLLGEDEREIQNGLNTIAEQTGGKMYTNHNDLDIPMRQAFDANRFYYVLSYYLNPGNEERRFRKIKVRVRNHPEYTVRAARGFMPSDIQEQTVDEAQMTPQQRLVKAVHSLVPLGQINVTARADFLESESDDKKITLTVDFDPGKLGNRNREQGTVIGMEILSLIYDASGKQVEAVSAKVQGKLTEARLEQAEVNGYRFTRRLALNPGVYQARVGVREEGTDRLGTAVTWLEVPELSEERFEISSLTLRPSENVNSSDNEMNGEQLEPIRLVQGIPSYGREAFCEYSFRVRRGRRKSGQSDLVFMRELLKDGVPAKQETWAAILESEMKPDLNGWFEIKDDMDLRNLPLGIYELRVSVKDKSSGRTIQRTAAFSIE